MSNHEDHEHDLDDRLARSAPEFASATPELMESLAEVGRDVRRDVAPSPSRKVVRAASIAGVTGLIVGGAGMAAAAAMRAPAEAPDPEPTAVTYAYGMPQNFDYIFDDGWICYGTVWKMSGGSGTLEAWAADHQVGDYITDDLVDDAIEMYREADIPVTLEDGTTIDGSYGTAWYQENYIDTGEERETGVENAVRLLEGNVLVEAGYPRADWVEPAYAAHQDVTSSYVSAMCGPDEESVYAERLEMAAVSIEAGIWNLDSLTASSVEYTQRRDNAIEQWSMGLTEMDAVVRDAGFSAAEVDSARTEARAMLAEME